MLLKYEHHYKSHSMNNGRASRLRYCMQTLQALFGGIHRVYLNEILGHVKISTTGHYRFIAGYATQSMSSTLGDGIGEQFVSHISL